MLTTSTSQYLHPDYLQPLPTTLDAKKSPLALLAQTCSSIGKDPAPSKSIIPPIEKKDVPRTSPERSDTIDNKRPCSSEDRKTSGRDTAKSDTHRQSAPPKDIPSLVPIGSNSNSGEQRSRTSSPVHSDAGGAKSASDGVSSTSSSTSTTNSSGAAAQSSNSRISLSCGNMLLELNHSESASSASTKPPSLHHNIGSLLPPSTPLGTSSLKPGYPLSLSGLPSYPGGLSLLSHGLSLDGFGHGYPHPSHLSHGALGYSPAAAAAAAAAAASASALKASAATASLSPYVAYARVRTPAGGTTLVPVCRDPYCTNCQLTLQNSHLSSTCTAAGCTQCAHEKALMASLPCNGLGIPSTYALTPGLSTVSSLAASASMNPSLLASSFYPPGLLASATGHGLPYVCNWVAGNEYCGKRFSNSEELLQHLRSHTSASDMAAAAASLVSPYSFGLHSASALAACNPYSSPGSLSPNSLRRAYPLSLSPVSSVLNANRYHPYKTSAYPMVPGAPSPAHSALSAYYPLYSQRLGAAVAP